MNCFLSATDSPSPLPIPTPSNSISHYPCPCPELPPFERDYMGLRRCITQDIADNKIPASLPTNPLIHKFSLADLSTHVDDLCGSHLKLAPPSSGISDIEDGDADDGEPLSVNIGWPPISSYRKSTTKALISIKLPCSIETTTPLIVNEAPLDAEEATSVDDDDEASPIPHMNLKASLRKPLHIKVSMDGTPIMRKLDLHTMQGYHHLSLELHKLFKFYKRHLSCEVGAHSCFPDLYGSSFILTYKDRDGDWKFVGDTPWETFAQSARRIRIMRKAK